MPRLTEVSEDLKEFASDVVEVEPFIAELESPAVLPPQAPKRRSRRLQGFSFRGRRYLAAVDLVRNTAASQPASNTAGANRRYRLKALGGKVFFFSSLFGTLVLSPIVIAALFPKASPITTLLLFAGVLFYTLLLIRLCRVPEKRIERALQGLEYKRAVSIFNRCERFWFAGFVSPRAQVLLSAGMFAEAEQWIRATILSGSGTGIDIFRYGCALQGLGQNEEAEHVLTAAAELLPDGEPIIALADLMLKRRANPREVLDLLDSGMKRFEEIPPEFSVLQNARVAWALSRQNEIEEADRLLKRSFELVDPSDKVTTARLLLYRAEMLFDRGKRTEAAATAKKCLVIDPEGPTHSDARMLVVAAGLRESEPRQPQLQVAQFR